jgi:predicted dehydrogenase
MKEDTIKSPLRVGIVGMGGRSTFFATYFSQFPSHGEVVALCDTVPEKARYLAELNKLRPAIYSDTKDMIRDAGLDVLFISTPDYLHVEPATAALAAGIHVYCEKPMATTLEDCDRMIAAAKKSSAVFYLGFNLRHGVVHETVHELITAGRIGKVTTIEANEYYYLGKTYFMRWNRLRKFGGGLWITKATHDFDLLNWMAGAPPVTVYAAANLSHYRPKKGAAKLCRHCKLQFECPDYFDIFDTTTWWAPFNKLRLIGEAHGQDPGDLCLYNSDKDTFDNGVAVVTYANDIRTTYTVNVLSAVSTRQMRVVGTEGQIEADLHQGKVLVTERHTGRRYEYNTNAMGNDGHGGGDNRIMRDFFHTIRTRKPPRSGWAEGRLAVQVGLAAQESLDTGAVVKLA